MTWDIIIKKIFSQEKEHTTIKRNRVRQVKGARKVKTQCKVREAHSSTDSEMIKTILKHDKQL
jgi:hypothetical protein